MDKINFVFVLYILVDVVSCNDTEEGILKTLKSIEITQNQLKAEIDNLKKESEKKDILIQTLIATDKENKARIETLEKNVAVLSDKLKPVTDKTDIDINLETNNHENNVVGTELTEKFGAPESTHNKRILLHGGTPDYPRIAFSAYLDHTLTNLGTAQAIIYNQVYLNEGGAYSNVSGIFTVPVSSIYLFTWSSVASKDPALDKNQIWISLMVNTNRFTTTMAETQGDWDDNQGSNTIILHVNKDDLVFIERYSGKTLFSEHSHRVTTFSGVLLFPDTQ